MPAHPHDPARSETPDGRARLSPIRLGVWASDGDNFHFVDPILERLPDRYEVHRFSCHPGLSTEAMRADLDRVDMAWFEWATGPVIPGSRLAGDRPAVCRLHRYEAYGEAPQQITWGNIDRLIFISEGVRETFSRFHKNLLPPETQTVVIPNAVALDAFPFDPGRQRNFDVAFLGRLHLVKNPMLLLQILKRLVEIDERYTLHVAGALQHVEVGQYLTYHVRQMELERHFAYYGALEPDQVRPWLSQCSCLLTTSVIEGHPVGVMEAMAMGLKPVIHDFIGARSIFPDAYLFNTVDEAAAMIADGPFEPARYRQFIADKYDVRRQVEQVVDLLDRLASNYYPERMAAHFIRERAARHEPADGPADALFVRAKQHLAEDEPEEAAHLLERLPFDALEPADALAARALALQLAVSRARYTDALFHADAALDLAEDEPQILHLMGQALWASGHERAGAEALVRAAEILQAPGRTAGRLPVDEASVYFMAGEACRHFAQDEAAQSFFALAQPATPER